MFDQYDDLRSVEDNGFHKDVLDRIQAELQMNERIVQSHAQVNIRV